MKTDLQKIFFNTNLKILRERKKLSQENLALYLGITRAKLAALEAGNTKAPQPEDYLRISDFFKISIDTLLKIDLRLLGELKIRELEAGQDVYIKGGNLRVLAISVDKSNNENVEYVPIKAKAGYTTGYHDPQFIATLPKYTLPQLPKHGTYRIFPTTGDSMLPIPENSDIVARYMPNWLDIKPGTLCIVVLKTQQDIVFKMVHIVADNQHLELHSLNPLYAPYIVPMEEVAEIWQFYSFSSKNLPPAHTDLDIVLKEIQLLKKHIKK